MALKYDESAYYPPQGDFSFIPNYRRTSQRVSIGPKQYYQDDIDAVLARGADLPTEVDSSLLRIQELGFRLWLSNIYVHESLFAIVRLRLLFYHVRLVGDGAVFDLLREFFAVWGFHATGATGPVSLGVVVED